MKFFENDSDLLATKTLSLNGGDVELKRAEIRGYFHKTFSLDEQVFECLASDESFYIKANPLRHPLIFYMGHTATFFVNKLFVANLIPERINPKLEAILAVGVDEMSWDDLNEINYDWPKVSEVREYRNQVRELVDLFIQNTPLKLPIEWSDPFWIVLMGIEHERIHIETSSVLVRELPLKAVRKNPLFKTCELFDEAPQNEMIGVKGAGLSLGKCRQNPLYGWDNEYGDLKIKQNDFEVSKFLVSNQEFLEFVDDKGYEKKEFWQEEGWKWREFTKASRPYFWSVRAEKYFYRTLTDEVKMPWSWPVDVNYHEAKAFCNWKSQKTGKALRLPTEAEWMLLRKNIEVDAPYWERAPGNINLEYWASACPVNQFESRNGVCDIIGNVWQWTETPVDAFPGFEVHPAYDDFSVPTFDGRHNLIKGGSFFSTGNLATKDSRYAFRKHFFQHAGFRYVESEETPHLSTNPYETDELVSQYIEFHFGDEYFGVPNFPLACMKACSGALKDRQRRRALDLGCAVGRASFELARSFEHVDALDFSARFIQIGEELKQKALKRYAIASEGEMADLKEINIDQIYPKAIRERCHFVQGDACNLNPKFSNYDLIFAGNLIDRLYSPRRFLESIHERIVNGGLLILTSPYTWLETYTPKGEWIGGLKIGGENQTTLEGLKKILKSRFHFLDAHDIPFVIRETKRKFQHTISQMTIWERRKT